MNGVFSQRLRWLLLFAVVAVASPASAQTYTWSGPNNGNWSTATNWSPQVTPNAPGVAALIDGNTFTGQYVIVDGSFTLGRLTFDNTFGETLNASSGGSLTLDNGASASVIEVLPDSNGSSRGTISGPTIAIAGNNTLNLNALQTGSFGESSLIISNRITGTSSTVNINSGGERGTVILNPGQANTYGGATSRTIVSGGRLVAQDGIGLPTNSALQMSNAVWEVPTTSTITRMFGNALGGQNIEMGGSEAGFAASDGATVTVRLNNGTGTVVWGSSMFNMGALFLGSAVSGNGGVVFENGLDLNGADRTITLDGRIMQNPTGHRITGVISNSAGTAGLNIDGGGVLILTAANTYNGPTTLKLGTLRALDGQGLPSTSNLNLTSSPSVSSWGIFESLGNMTFSRSLGTAAGQVQFTNGGGALSAHDGTMTVRLNGGAGTIAWGTPGFLSNGERLNFGSKSFTGVVDFQNGLDLGGQERNFGVEIPSGGNQFGLVRMSGAITNGGVNFSNGGGTVELAAANTYTGQTTVSFGALRAVLGVGLPDASPLLLAGGVYEGMGPTTFTRNLGSGVGQVRLDSSGGFSAYGGTMTVRLNNGTSTLTMGSANFAATTLLFGSRTANSLVDFQNGLNLNGQARTFEVEDNPNSAGDIARISGVITNGGVTKNYKLGTLELTGANTYTGQTTIQGGAIRANDGAGLPTTSNLLLFGGVLEGIGPTTFSRNLGLGAGQVWLESGGGFSASGGVMQVRLNGGAPVTWGSTSGFYESQDIVRFGSATANNVADLQNDINLNGNDMRVFATRNPGYSGPVGRLSGVISNGRLLVNGGAPDQTGTLELTGANTYAGGTTVSYGRLLVNNTAGSGTGAGRVDVGFLLGGQAATLGGNGRIAPAAGNPVTLNNATRIEPGWGTDNSLRIETNGGGTINIGNSFSAGAATWAMRINSAGTGGIAANSGGSTQGTVPDPTNHTFLDLSGGGADTIRIASNTLFEIDGTGAGFTLGQRYSYAVGRAGSANEFQGGPLNFTNQSQFTAIGFQANDFSLTSGSDGTIYLNFTPVPEPATVLLTAVAGLGLSASRRLLRR